MAVTLGGDSAYTKVKNEIFGSTDLFAGGSVFAGSSQQSGSALLLSAKSLDRELNRLLGFKTDLSPAQQKKLNKLQTRIQEIETEASSKGFTQKTLDERNDAYQEAYEIMGKEYVNKEADPELVRLSQEIDNLLAPPLRGAQKRRLENLRAIEDDLIAQAERSGGSDAARARVRNVKGQISKLTTPREIRQLSQSERREYNSLVEKINEIAGSEFVMPAAKRQRAESIQTSLSEINAQIQALGLDSYGASPADAARAYARL